MKKIIAILLCLVMITITACGNSSNDDTSKESNQEKEINEGNEESNENEDLEVDKGLLNVTITLPASMFEGEDIDKEVEEIKEEGIKDVKVNDDGSMTVKMTKTKHKELVKEVKDTVLEYFEELKASEDTPSINDVKYDDNFKEVTLEVDKKKFEESFDSMAVFGVAMTTAMYHIYEGVPAEEVNFKINAKDSGTGEIFNTILYPDDLEDME